MIWFILCKFRIVHSIHFNYCVSDDFFSAHINRVDDSNVPQGQLGIALLTHSQIHSSKLILYKTKDQLLSTLVLKETGTLFWKSPYLQYHDDLSVFWSLLFANVDDFNELSKHLSGQCEVIQTPSDEHSRSTTGDRQVTHEQNNEPANIGKKGSESEQNTSNNVASERAVSNGGEEKSSKSDILSRVVKVGHRIPLINPLDSDVVDSKSSEAPPHAIPRHVGKPPTALNETPKSPSKSTTLPNTLPPDSSGFNAFTSEYRLQGTELRINIAKLDTKLDRIIDNIELLQLNANTTLSPKDNNELEDEIIKLEERILELKKENRCQKLRLQENDMLRKQKSEQAEKEDSKVEMLRTECDAKQAKIDELSTQVDNLLASHRSEVDGLKKEHDTEIHSLQSSLETKSAEIESLQQKITDASAKSGEMVRAILNEFYQKLHDTISDEDNVSTSDILKLSADIIRKETKAALSSKWRASNVYVRYIMYRFSYRYLYLSKMDEEWIMHTMI